MELDELKNKMAIEYQKLIDHCQSVVDDLDILIAEQKARESGDNVIAFISPKQGVK